MGIINSADQILNQTKAQTIDVAVPEFGDKDTKIRVTTISAKTRDDYEFYYQKHRDKISFRALWVSACCVDENGKALFSTEQAEGLSEVNAQIIQRLFLAANQLNYIVDTSIEELEKN